MEKKEIIIKLRKDIDIAEAVSKALNLDNKNTHKTIKASKKEEDGIQEGKLSGAIGEFRGLAG